MILALGVWASNSGSAAAQTDWSRPSGPLVVTPRADIAYALADWRRLRQGGSLPFAYSARFLSANPGWPGEAGLRHAAERAMTPNDSPSLVLEFFRAQAPMTARGHVRHAEALAAAGRPAEAQAAAREAWGASNLDAFDEATILARFGNALTTPDHERRLDRLLADRQPLDALRLMAWSGPRRRAAFSARIAIQMRAADADSQFAPLAQQMAGDAGLLIDRAAYLRDGGNEFAAAQLLARPHAFTDRPADAERWLEMLLKSARGAAAQGQWQMAFDMSRQLDDIFPAGADLGLKPLAVRDHYTSLAWLAGTVALQRLRRPADAIALFERYSRGGRSLQVHVKGLYWAGRAAITAGQPARAAGLFSRAALHPDQFYGQLALERQGRPVPPPAELGGVPVSDSQRLAFAQRRLVQAIEQLGREGRRSEQTLCIRALSEAARSDSERVLAIELARRIVRQDLAVWTARSARNGGAQFYVRSAYPLIERGLADQRLWSIAHGITRQESSFDRAAMSGAGARGMMQLMLPTAREQAGKMGIPYDSERLLADPSYNVMLGSAYFARLLSRWSGNYPLAVASYNAGAGNVAKWVRLYGDPRLPGADVVRWIEDIPFTETRGYVQRVLENTVVYDRLSPLGARSATPHLSQYLGKSRPG